MWQYVTLTKKIYLIDSPGVVYDVGDDEVETVLKGVVRSERLKEPCDFVAPMLSRLNPDHIARVYGVSQWSDDVDFMTQVAKLKGKLLPSGEPDMPTVAKMMINDWQRGRLPYFVPPPRPEGEEEEEEEEAEGGGKGVGEELPESFERSDEEDEGEGEVEENAVDEALLEDDEEEEDEADEEEEEEGGEES